MRRPRGPGGKSAGPLAAFAAAALAGLVAGCAETPDRTGLATVTGVVDGDTIDVRLDGRDERVRLIGIDTPETEHPERPVECHGPEASEFTRALLPPGTSVRIERDVVGRDHFGRLLGYVHVVDPDRASVDGAALFVNLEIVEQGHAVPLTFAPNDRYADAIAAAATRAEAADRGLWGACSD